MNHTKLTMMSLNENPHRRLNILTGEWVLVSPHRTKRPWQGKKEDISLEKLPSYDPNCYLCPTNIRAGGEVNPDYQKPYAFDNDFGALLADTTVEEVNRGLLKGKSEPGICRVVCFSPDHSKTLPLMSAEEIEEVISLWQREYKTLGQQDLINHVMIFENKGAIMGCSNPHPHGQIWAQSSVPEIVSKKTERQLNYYKENNRSLLSDYVEQELMERERVVYENDGYVVLVPYWAVWPYETMIIPKRHLQHIGQLTVRERSQFAEAIKAITTRYDNLFETSFPYSAGIHQSPTDGEQHKEWHLHMSFYPPLLRSATVKKFMVGYEMFANPQRDITAEQAADKLRSLGSSHFSLDI